MPVFDMWYLYRWIWFTFCSDEALAQQPGLVCSADVSEGKGELLLNLGYNCMGLSACAALCCVRGNVCVCDCTGATGDTRQVSCDSPKTQSSLFAFVISTSIALSDCRGSMRCTFWRNNQLIEGNFFYFYRIVLERCRRGTVSVAVTGVSLVKTNGKRVHYTGKIKCQVERERRVWHMKINDFYMSLVVLRGTLTHRCTDLLHTCCVRSTENQTMRPRCKPLTYSTVLNRFSSNLFSRRGSQHWCHDVCNECVIYFYRDFLWLWFSKGFP